MFVCKHVHISKQEYICRCCFSDFYLSHLLVSVWSDLVIFLPKKKKGHEGLWQHQRIYLKKKDRRVKTLWGAKAEQRLIWVSVQHAFLTARSQVKVNTHTANRHRHGSLIRPLNDYKHMQHSSRITNDTTGTAAHGLHTTRAYTHIYYTVQTHTCSCCYVHTAGVPLWANSPDIMEWSGGLGRAPISGKPRPLLVDTTVLERIVVVITYHFDCSACYHQLCRGRHRKCCKLKACACMTKTCNFRKELRLERVRTLQRRSVHVCVHGS